MHTIPIALPTGLPNGSNITKNGGKYKWIPSSNDINNVYTITIKLFNTDSYNNPVNKYEETFTVKVTDGSTQQMTTGKSGLIIDKKKETNLTGCQLLKSYLEKDQIEIIEHVINLVFE